tara:strand:- start:134 stop:532 length:399 start_codon:yes stop_codon:yes gene_type:complete
MPTPDDELKREFNKLADKVSLKDSEVSALMSIVIQTNKEVSHNLVRLTEVVSNVTVLEKAQEAQQETINALSAQVATNEIDIKLSLQNSDHIKESLEEIKENQKDARAWGAKIFSSIILLAIVGGLITKFNG